jgi:hypothetical protein
VDKQTRTTAATKKYVDNGYLMWFKLTTATTSLWKTENYPKKNYKKGREPGESLIRIAREILPWRATVANLMHCL